MLKLKLSLLLSLLTASLWAQDGNNPSMRSHATLFGIGTTNKLDTYLSPQEYTGTEFRMAREHRRMTTLLDGRVGMQNMLQGNFASCKSPSNDGTTLSGMVEWSFAWHYHWKMGERLVIMAGPGTEIQAGCTYNMRNGNNPVQVQLSWDILASGAVEYTLPLFKRNIVLRYQANFPIAGLMFSPNYGQSYYEIFSLGHTDHNVCFTHPFQAVCFNQFVTADIPLGHHKLRAGYLCAIRQSKVNNLKYHSWSHLFMLGYVKYFQLLKNK